VKLKLSELLNHYSISTSVRVQEDVCFKHVLSIFLLGERKKEKKERKEAWTVVCGMEWRVVILKLTKK